MRGLVEGIISFRNEVVPRRREFFANLASGQSPECMLVACSDSRIAPNMFALTDPGECFVHRCVGNLIPQHAPGHTVCTSEGAAIEYAVKVLKVKHIIICGHSECGAVMAYMKNCDTSTYKSIGNSNLPFNVSGWIEHAAPALVHFAEKDYDDFVKFDDKTADHNMLAMLNVLVQMEHVYSYPDVADAVEQGVLRIHGWFFDIANGEVRYYDIDEKSFLPIDEKGQKKIISDIDIVAKNWQKEYGNLADPHHAAALTRKPSQAIKDRRRKQLQRMSRDSILFRKLQRAPSRMASRAASRVVSRAASPTRLEKHVEENSEGSINTDEKDVSPSPPPQIPDDSESDFVPPSRGRKGRSSSRYVNGSATEETEDEFGSAMAALKKLAVSSKKLKKKNNTVSRSKKEELFRQALAEIVSAQGDKKKKNALPPIHEEDTDKKSRSKKESREDKRIVAKPVEKQEQKQGGLFGQPGLELPGPLTFLLGAATIFLLRK